MKQTLIIASAVLLAMFMITTASAAGVTVPYYKDNTLKVYAGDTTNIGFNLQNGGENSGTIIFKTSILQGSEIATLTGGDTYIVPANGEVPVNVQLTIPKDAAAGTKYPLSISFVSVTSGAGNAVKMGVGMEASLEIVVEEKPAEQPAPLLSTTTLIVIVAIIIVIILLIVLSKTASKRK